MAKCWKCGKEIHGFQESLVGLSTCPECETLALLKDMREEKRIRDQWEDDSFDYDEDDENRPRRRRRRHRHIKEEPIVYEPTDSLSPEWWKRARNPKSSGAAAVLAFLFGEWGFPFIYIGREYTILGIGMFAIFITLMVLYPMASLIYLFFTNILLGAIFLAMDDNDFLKRFRKDLWIDKQIADQYGHETDEFGNYIGIPLQKPTWEEAFAPKQQKEASQENQRTPDVPSEDGASQPKIRLKIVK